MTGNGADDMVSGSVRKPVVIMQRSGKTMGLEKAIKYGKEKRKPYTGSKQYCRSCRNHGSCPWCRRNRLFKWREKHPDDIQKEVANCVGESGVVQEGDPDSGKVVEKPNQWFAGE